MYTVQYLESPAKDVFVPFLFTSAILTIIIFYLDKTINEKPYWSLIVSAFTLSSLSLTEKSVIGT